MREPDAATQPLPQLGAGSPTAPLGPYPADRPAPPPFRWDAGAVAAGAPGASHADPTPRPARSGEADAAGRARRRRRRRWGIAIAAVGLVGALIGAELAARALVGGIAAEEISRALPPEVRAEVRAEPTGACVLCELGGGGLSGLDVHGDSVAVGGLTGTIDAHAADVRLGDPVRVGALEGTVDLHGDELAELLRTAANAQGLPLREVRFGEGELDSRAELEAFGVVIGADIGSRLELRSGGRLQVQATSISIDAGGLGGGLELDPASFSMEFCLAEHLPANLEITSLRVHPEGLEIGVRTTGPFETIEQAFAELGACR